MNKIDTQNFGDRLRTITPLIEKMNSSDSRLKYSKRLCAAGAISVAALGMGDASAAVSMVDVNGTLIYSTGYFRFSPLSNAFVVGSGSGYTASIRNCGLNLLNFNTAEFQWVNDLLAAGSMVDGSQTYSNSSSIFESYPSAGQTVYAGYRVVNQGPGNDETYYGYVQVTGVVPAIEGQPDFQIDFYSYETSPNTAITIIPEPSVLGLGGITVLLLCAKRRRN